MHTLRIDVHESDEVFLKDLERDIGLLVGMVKETFEDRPESLLSPIIREMVLITAKRVERKRQKLAGLNLYLDNPSGPISGCNCDE